VPESIFRITSDGELETVHEAAVVNEERLQALLANYPDVLAGNQISQAEPRRWILVSREIGVPDADDAASRWSLDHLFLDQDGIPTLVEVKRSVDTRIRREVVGQLLDYAANAAVYWKIAEIRAALDQRCSEDGISVEEHLAERVGVDPEDADDYWSAVETNLRAGRMRLIFLANEIPNELRRIIEFLNAQMAPAEVFGVELRQFGHEAGAVLVPKIVGRTAVAERSKATGRRIERQWDEESFFAELAKDRDPREVDVAKRLLDWGKLRYPKIRWGRGAKRGYFYPMYGPTIFDSSMFGVATYGRLVIGFVALAEQPPFDAEDLRFEFLRRLHRLVPNSISDHELSAWPSITLADLVESNCIDRLLDEFQWVFDQIKR